MKRRNKHGGYTKMDYDRIIDPQPEANWEPHNRVVSAHNRGSSLDCSVDAICDTKGFRGIALHHPIGSMIETKGRVLDARAIKHGTLWYFRYRLEQTT